jgi:hypothetical protein
LAVLLAVKRGTNGSQKQSKAAKRESCARFAGCLSTS